MWLPSAQSAAREVRDGEMLRFLVVLSVLSGLSCSTSYKEEGLGGGYSDTPLAANMYRVDVRSTRH